MSTELEQLLRGGMERFTEDVQLPQGLALKVHRNRQKRRKTARAVTVAGTVTVLTAGAVAVAGVTGAFGSAGGQQINGQQYQASAYVVTRVEHALAAPGRENVLGYTRKEFPPGSMLEPVGPSLLRASVSPGASSPWSVGYTVTWLHHGTMKISSFSPAGQPVFDLGFGMVQGVPTTIVVLYGSRTWWTAPDAGSSAARGPGPGAASCGPDISLNSGAGNGWPAFIRSQLSCGEYALDGRQRIDGIDAIKITGNKGLDTLWVDPATYLPVRAILSLGRVQTQADFRWLAPTPAHLTKLHVSVPAGFRQVPPPS